MWYDPVLEKRFSKIAARYLGPFMFGYFLFDVLACLPVLSYEAINGFKTDYDDKWEQINSA